MFRLNNLKLISIYRKKYYSNLPLKLPNSKNLNEVEEYIEGYSIIDDNSEINSKYEINYIIMNEFGFKFNNLYSANRNNLDSKKQPFLSKILNDIPSSVVLGVAFSCIIPELLKGVQFNITTFNIKLGQSLAYYHFYRNLKLKYNKERLTDSKKEIEWNEFQNKYSLNDSNYFHLGSIIMSCFTTATNLITYNIKKEYEYGKFNNSSYYKLTEFGINFIKKHNIFIGLLLPLVIPPKIWSKNENGGYYFLSQKIPLPLIHHSILNQGKTYQIDDSIYNQINYQNSVPFRINKNFYDFILKYGYELNILINPNLENANESLLSQILHQKYILDISKLYYNYTFYLPLFFDWRGRIYSQPSYLTYQGSSLAKALMEFAEGGHIETEEHINVLLAYGASLYGYGKLSYMERVNWTKNNFDNILLMDSQFLIKAEDPCLFIAFCLEIKNNFNSIKFNKPFISHFPIQWDATCNGLQHLSLLCNDVELANSVNICYADLNTKPNDIYTDTLNYIKSRIQENKDDPLYKNILSFPLTRSFIKRSILTISYSVTVKGVFEQLAGQMIKKLVNKKIIYELEFESSVFSLSYKELFLLSKIVHQSLFLLHPKLKIFNEFLKEVIYILYKNDLSIQWTTPNGLLINQKYILFDKIAISYRLKNKYKKVSIQKPSDKIDVLKQYNSIVPNLIHSLDASTLTLLVNKIINSSDKIPFYSLHDCFASTANNMHIIKNYYQQSLTDIYSDNKIILKIYENLLNIHDSHKDAGDITLKIPKDLVNKKVNKELMELLKSSFNIII